MFLQGRDFQDNQQGRTGRWPLCLQTLSVRCRLSHSSRRSCSATRTAAVLPPCFTDLQARVTQTRINFQPYHCQKEGHHCAKKKEAARKTSSTLKRKPACSLKTGSQQALFPHEDLKHLQIPTESTLWLAAPSHDVLADALLKQSLNRAISVVMRQQLPRPCVQTVAHGAIGIADVSCVHAVLPKQL